MTKYILSTLLVLAVIVAAIVAPYALQKYRDKKSIGIINTQKRNIVESGYQYELSSSERLSFFSKLYTNHMILQRYDMSPSIIPYYPKINSYIFTVNDPVPFQISKLMLEVNTLKELGVLPESFSLNTNKVTGNLYTLSNNIDISENITIWELTNGSTDIKNLNNWKIYMDAQTEKIYSFFIDGAPDWKDINPENIMKAWCQYLTINTGVEILEEGYEKTPYFKKYELPNERVTLTIGLYPWTNTLFLKTDG